MILHVTRDRFWDRQSLFVQILKICVIIFQTKESCVTISENENKIKFVCSVKDLCDHF